MKTIWKYTLQPGLTGLEMPEGAQILNVQEQAGEARLWALVDPKAKLTARRFRVYGTGHPVLDNPGTYVGTFQLQAEGLVFHVFEEQV